MESFTSANSRIALSLFFLPLAFLFFTPVAFAAPDITAPFIGLSGDLVLNRTITFSGDVWNRGEGMTTANSYALVRIGGPAQITNRGNYVTVAGIYAYTSSNNGSLSGNSFEVFDISAPTAPERVTGEGADPSPYGDIVVVGDEAYVATRGGLSPLQVFVLSSLPSSLLSEGGVNISEDVGTGVTYKAPYLYVSGFSGRAIQIYDVAADPLSPAFQGSAVSTLTNTLARTIAVKDNYAYVLGNRSIGGGFLEVFDVAYPIDTQSVTQFTFPESFDAAVIAGDYLYAGHFQSTGFSVFDISTRTAPLRIAVVSSGAPWAGELQVSGNYLYIGGDPEGAVYDISDPGTPVEVSHYAVLNSAGDSGKFVTPSYLYHASDALNIYEPHTFARFCLSDEEYNDAARDACLHSAAGRVGSDIDAGVLDLSESTTVGTTWTAALGVHTVYFCADVRDGRGFDGVAEGANEGGASNCTSTTFVVSIGALFGNPSSCVIAIGESTCTVGMSWATTDALDPKLVNRKTGVTLSTEANSPAPFSVLVSSPTTIFDLRNGDNILDTEVIAGTCALGSEWDGEICAPATLWTTLEADPPGGAPPLLTTVTASATGTAVDVLSITNWTISYATPASDIASIAFDSTHGVLYAGSGSYGIIYRCDTVTLCDESSDWTVTYDAHGSGNEFSSFIFDVQSGALYAGTSPGGNIYRCSTAVTLCDADEDWVRVARLDDSAIDSLILDGTNGVFYAGTGEHGKIYRCAIATNCAMEESWVLAFDTPESVIAVLVFDSTHGIIYAGTRSNGIIYRCNPAFTACDESGDWMIAYDTAEAEIDSLAFNATDGLLFAGSGANGIIYRCDTSTSCRNGASDWRVSYDTPSGTVNSLVFDSAGGVVYAGTGGSGGDHGIIYRCDHRTPGNCNDAGDWTLSEGIEEIVIRSLAVDTMNGPLYAGSATNGIIYRSGGNDTADYHFWWNCSSTTNDVSVAESICGVLPPPLAGSCVENSFGTRCTATTTAQMSVSHNYPSVGTYTAKVIVEARSAINAEARTTIVLTLIPVLSVTPSHWDFGSVYLGDSETRSFTVENIGQVGSFLEGRASLSGLLPAYFTCTAGCGAYPDPGISVDVPRTVTIRFSPGQTTGLIGPVNTRFTGTNTTPPSSLDLPVFGTGVLPIVGSGLDFGSVVVTRSKNLVLTVVNRGSTAFSDTLVLPFPGIYTCVPDCNLTVPARSGGADGTEEITIHFAPTQVRDYNGNAYLENHPLPNGPLFPFTGTGIVGTFKFKDQ